jgi:hypothetical protein
MEITPTKQAGIILAMMLVFNLLWVIATSAGVDLEQRFPWLIATALMLFFGLFNSVFSLTSSDRMAYWRNSIIAYAVICASGGVLAWLFSGLTMDEAGAFKWMYFIMTFSFITFLTIVNLMRKIVDIAQKQDKRLRGEE